MSIRVPTTSQQQTNVVFETAFTSDAGYTVNSGLWETSNVPTGWDGAKASGTSTIDVVSGLGIGGTPACRLTYDPVLIQPTISLFKLLPSSYTELYIRYRVKFPDTFKAGNGDGGLDYWKWGRLWQNTTASTATWTENRVDSFYAVWNFASGNATIYQTNSQCAWGANSGDLTGGSSGGDRYRVRYSLTGGVPTPKPGHFEAVGSGAWDLDWVTNPGRFKTYPGAQTWHTIEWHFKLATSDAAADGIWEAWYDGVHQGAWSDIAAQGPTPPPTKTGLPTTANPSGWNAFVFFDNMVGWNADWDVGGVDGRILINDVVVATSRIGHDYNPA